MGEYDGVSATLRLSGVGYIEFLQTLHTHLVPRSYLEVGTASGTSLAVANCDAIVVGPQIAAGAVGNRRRTFFFQMTSDEFFASESAPALLGRPVDLAFLDGMHWFEYLLRDFIGAEAACHARSLILLPACVPSNTRMALRQYEPGDSGEGDTAGWWTGDVWKLLPILREYRPDLRLHVLDCPPAGLVAITGLDPASSILSDRYHEIVDRYAATVLDEDLLKSLWDNLELSASRELCEQPDRLAALFGPHGSDQPNGPRTNQEARPEIPLRTRPSQDVSRPGEVLPPRELQDWVGGGGPAAFNATGDEFLGYLVDLCGLRPGDAVLDVGCGSGRMALPLTGYLNREGRYAGFDVSSEAIAWCTENISRSHPNFDFTVVDIQNSLYNPAGRCEASDFRFPYPDGSFDVVLLASLFTHMLPADVKHYLHEIFRVLKPGGRSLITYFLLNETSSALSSEGKTSFHFEHEMQGYRTTHLDHPEAATAYQEASIRDFYKECGLEIREPLHYGSWCGRTDGMSGQDVVIAVKSANMAASWSTQENDHEPGFGRSVSFAGRGHSEEIIGPGWSLQEEHWRWMTGGSSVLTFPMPTDGNAADFILMLRVTPFLANGQIDSQRCTVVCGSETIAEVEVRASSWIGFRISAEAGGSKDLAILFVHPDAESPQKYGIVPDPRELAIAVHEVILLPATEGDEPMGWRGSSGLFVSSDWRAQNLAPDWKRVANNFQSMGQDCEFGLLQRHCEAEPLGLFRFANTQLHGLTECLRSDFSALTDQQEFNLYLYQTGEYHGQYESLGLIQHTHVLADQSVDVDALRDRELTRIKTLVRFFREDLEDGEKVFVLVRKFPPLDDFEVLPVISLMRRYSPKAALLWITVAGPGERHKIGQCEVVGNNLLKGYIDRFSGQDDDWSTLSVECWKDILVAALQALGRPIPIRAGG